jgi:hypothetical protein
MLLEYAQRPFERMEHRLGRNNWIWRLPDGRGVALALMES